jgi:putative ABC transport system substrate-binding protein
VRSQRQRALHFALPMDWGSLFPSPIPMGEAPSPVSSPPKGARKDNEPRQAMKRKIVFVLLAILSLSFFQLAEAQQPAKVPRIGYLTTDTGGRGSRNAEALRQGLRDLGYVEGQNIAIELRSAEGNNDRLPAMAAELVRLKVDLIFAAGGTPVSFAARKATNVIPIVFVGSIDPVFVGLVDSLARPGGNITGFSTGAPGMYGKRLELLKETLPTLSRVGVLLNPANAAADVVFKEIRSAGQDMGLQVHSLEVRSPNDIDSAFVAATKALIGALVVTQQPPVSTNPKRVVELAAKRRLPAIYTDPTWIAADGLMSYGPNIPDLYRRAAISVDKILKGTKPADLPVEQPVKYELMINLKTAKTLGLTIPPGVLMRAEKVIK